MAYFPAPIPRTLELPGPTVRLLAEAESALGQLAGVGRLLPNPDLLIRPYLLREALSSTRIEGTQASLAEVLETEAGGERPNADVEEVVNYVEAMSWGLERLRSLPISTRLICEMHRRLMAGVRGREHSPGELRTSQNWIGRAGSTIETVDFVPPPPPRELADLLADWERFAHEESEMPLLVQRRAAPLAVRDDPPVPRWQRAPWSAAARLLPRHTRPALRAAALPERVPRAETAGLLRRPPGDPRIRTIRFPGSSSS